MAETISAVCAAVAIIGAVFLWVVKMVVEKAVRDAVNGFKVEIAVLRQRLESAERTTAATESYAHSVMHERINAISEALLDAFRAGQHAGK